MAIKNVHKKIEEIAVDDKSGWLEKARYRRENRRWLRKSQRIAVRVLRILNEKGMQQKELAKAMDVSPQQISKIVKGKENLTLQTISKLEQELGVSLFEVPHRSFKMEVASQKADKINIKNKNKRRFTAKESLSETVNEAWKESEPKEHNLSLVA